MPRVQYSEAVEQRFRRPSRAGSLPDGPGVRASTVGSTATGGVLRLQIQLDESGIIKDARFKAWGCGATIAAGSYAAETVIGLTAQQAAAIRSTDIARALQLAPVKMHCAMLAEDAIKAAIGQGHHIVTQGSS